MSADEDISVSYKDGFKQSRGRLWMLTGVVIIVGAVVAWTNTALEAAGDNSMFYASRRVLLLDRVMSATFVLGLLFNAASYYLARSSGYPRSDAGGAAQIGFVLCTMAGIGMMARIAAITI